MAAVRARRRAAARSARRQAPTVCSRRRGARVERHARRRHDAARRVPRAGRRHDRAAEPRHGRRLSHPGPDPRRPAPRSRGRAVPVRLRADGQRVVAVPARIEPQNLLVLDGEHISGWTFFVRMAPMAFTATLVTAAGMLVVHRRVRWRGPGRPSSRTRGCGARWAWSRRSRRSPSCSRRAAPALPVLAIGAGRRSGPGRPRQRLTRGAGVAGRQPAGDRRAVRGRRRPRDAGPRVGGTGTPDRRRERGGNDGDRGARLDPRQQPARHGPAHAPARSPTSARCCSASTSARTSP